MSDSKAAEDLFEDEPDIFQPRRADAVNPPHPRKSDVLHTPVPDYNPLESHLRQPGPVEGSEWRWNPDKQQWEISKLSLTPENYATLRAEVEEARKFKKRMDDFDKEPVPMGRYKSDQESSNAVLLEHEADITDLKQQFPAIAHHLDTLDERSNLFWPLRLILFTLGLLIVVIFINTYIAVRHSKQLQPVFMIIDPAMLPDILPPTSPKEPEVPTDPKPVIPPGKKGVTGSGPVTFQGLHTESPPVV
jgi:hypothetical protein